MPVTPGTRIGPYEVVAPLGAGGMGEVYRARDAKVGRDVALKILPDEFAGDRDRRERFTREARALGALNHPNIAAIYGVEDSTAIPALVMELVPGPTLADRLRTGPIPVADALAVARQIAAGLEAAHHTGLIHRDLKPANIKVRDDGTVKILDFGLARAIAPDLEPAAADLANSPTLSRRGTEMGVILGTSAYMSPEQAKGRVVDKRTDVWAFGVVLYEMLTGRRAFTGEDVSEVLAAVITQTPSLDALPAATPPAIRRLIRRCLEKDQSRRIDSMHDVQIEIDDALAPKADDPAGRGPAPRSKQTAVWLVVAIAITAIAASLAGYVWRPAAAVPAEALRLSINLPSNLSQQWSGVSTPSIEFAPDGRSIILEAMQDGKPHIFRRFLNETDTRIIPGTEGATYATLSPDGRWMAFAAAGKLMKVPADGGRPFEIASAISIGALGAAWLDAGTLVYSPIYSDGLFRVSADGGTPERLTTPDHAGGELGHWWPQTLPDGKVLFTAFRTPVDSSRIGVVDPATRKIEWIVDGGFHARYAPDGHLLYARGDRLYAVPFDGRRGAVTGAPVAVLDDLFTVQSAGVGVFAVSKLGTLAYMSMAIGRAPRELVWFDRTGRVQPLSVEPQSYMSVSLAPDDRQIALTIQGDSPDLWIYSIDRGTLSRLTTGPQTEFDPVWSADGRGLFYVIDKPPFDLARIATAAPDSGRPLWKEPAESDTISPSPSHDGRWLAFCRNQAGTGDDIFVWPVDGSTPARPFRATKATESWPSFSADDRWIAYQSDETGRSEIYVEAFPGPGQRFQVSADGGTEPHWAAATGELFFRHGDEVRVVSTRAGGSFSIGTPRTLFTARFATAAYDSGAAYAVTSAGDRILAVRTPDALLPRRLEIVTNWTKLLSRPGPDGR